MITGEKFNNTFSTIDTMENRHWSYLLKEYKSHKEKKKKHSNWSKKWNCLFDRTVMKDDVAQPTKKKKN